MIDVDRPKGSRADADRALLSAALEHSADPTLIYAVSEHSEPTVVYANIAFGDAFGYSVPELVARGASVFWGDRTDRTVFERLADAARAGRSTKETVYIYARSGAELLVEWRGRQIDGFCRIVTLRDLGPLRDAREVLVKANRRLDSVISNNSDAIFTLDANGSCTDVNAEAGKRFGASRHELLGFGFDLVSSSGLFPRGQRFPSELAHGDAMRFEATYRHRDGRPLDFEVKAIPMLVDGRVDGAFVIARDVSEEKRAADLLAKQARRTHALYLISAASESAAISQIDAALALALETLQMQYAYVAVVEGDALRVVHASGRGGPRPGETFAIESSYAAPALSESDIVTFEDLSLVPLRPGAAPRSWRGYVSARLAIEGQPRGLVGFLSNDVVTFDASDRDFVRLVAALVASRLERNIQKERLSTLAYYDALTGLTNRAKFMRDLDAAVSQARRADRSFAVHFIDLDGFKAVNDAGGHAAGDLALREAARRLERTGRVHDLAARIGGDEFVVLQTDVSQRSDTIALGARLVDILSRPYDLSGETFELSASVGIAIFPEHGRDARSLIVSADLALYRAKANGKNRVEFA